MFSFDVENANVLYTAEQDGQLNRIDLRISSGAAGRKEANRSPSSPRLTARLSY
jgi:hypothetical protein